MLPLSLARLVVVASLLVLVACVSAQPEPESPAPQTLRTQGVESGRPAPQLALTPASLGRNLTLSQVVSGEWGEQRRSMRFEVEITAAADRMVIVGLDHLGVTLFTLAQQAQEITVTTFADEVMGVDPHWMLFDLQATYWPPEPLARALAPLRLKLEDDLQAGRRRIFDPQGDLMVEIAYHEGYLLPGAITIEHYNHRYSLRIEALGTGKPQ